MTLPAILHLTASAAPLARRAADALGGETHAPELLAADPPPDLAIGPEGVAAHLRALFLAGRPVVGVCAAGILIRALAPVLGDKRAEPPVLALSEDGRAAVPLLGGHHGANALAVRLEDALGARAAITTAGDLTLGVALDAPPSGWRLDRPERAKAAAAALLAGAALEIMRPDARTAAPDPELERWLAPLAERLRAAGRLIERREGADLDLIVRPAAAAPIALAYRRPTLALGVGCARGCPPEALFALADAALAEAGALPAALVGVFSLDLKADEAAVHALAARYGVPARFFDAERLSAEEARLTAPSEIVRAEVGCPGVAEGAALAAAGPEARLRVPKRKSSEATVALAEAPRPIASGPIASGPIAPLPGWPRGRLSVVGVGPGAADWRTPEASRLIAEADLLVGYGLYLDLLGPLARGKPRADFPLGGEEARCRHALEQAADGRDVALICSGDAGIYAMAALVMELLDRSEEAGGVSAAARRVEIRVAPGVSALQAAAARAGALLGHDFCAVSLSDLLTPRETILARLRAAAAGDFVLALYNPVSKTRRDLLPAAREILLAARPAETPVLLATDLGRPGERLRRRTLAGLAVDEIDMLTVVLIGSSASRAFETGDRSAGAEGWRLYTPRGYARKLGAEPQGREPQGTVSQETGPQETGPDGAGRDGPGRDGKDDAP
ncbi:MAG: precorrin-3B C(17)-methyltransferase [Pseudomonadota bacterium]